MRVPHEQTYALRLRAGQAATLCGEIEHVISGERCRFHDGRELTALLLQLQSKFGRPAPDPASAPSGPSGSLP
jgi:hypothetical protein